MRKVNKPNRLRRLSALLLVLCLGLTLTWPAAAEPEEPAGEAAEEETQEVVLETISIRTAEDLLALADNCSLDTWSRDKLVVLENDINLEGVDFAPIPSFGGVFQGGGHTIRGLNITGSYSPAGLFAVLQPGAQVYNLNAAGTVSPGGSGAYVGGIAGMNGGTLVNCTFSGTVSGADSTGGIAGLNALTGQIQGCSANGSVSGGSRTGGVAGNNSGTILNCENGAAVNNESVDPSMDLEDINLDLTLDLEHISSSIDSMDMANAPMDSGGIAGYSSGSIFNCTNTGVTGYPHVGYNVGGIAGRSCGQIQDCSNSAPVNGRKEVGGIVGQAEPYVITNLNASSLETLKQQLEEMGGLLDRAKNDAGGASAIVNSRLNNMSNYLDSALGEAKKIQPQASVSGSLSGGGDVSGGVSGGADTSVSGEAEGQAGAGAAAGGGVAGGGAESGGIAVVPGGAVSGGSGAVGAVGGSGVVAGGGGSASGGVDISTTVDIGHDGSGSGQISGGASITVNTDMSGLYSALSGLSGQIRLLNKELSGQGAVLSDDLSAINAQYNAILETCFDTLDSQSGGSTVSDTSEADVEAVTFGKVSGCANSGPVAGDLNVGGIAGAMSIEYSLDPEDDVTQDLDSSVKKEYELKAVLQGCENTGEVTAKRNCAGGIVGRANLGLVTGCMGCGAVESESGDYVGGIAGMNATVVRNSYAKAELSGGCYVGGITGCGVSESADGTGSEVTGCYSLVSIDGASQFCGAISGCDAGTFRENYFVSDTLAGLDRLSYAGQAEPISYEALLETEGLPEAFRSLTLRFVADGIELKAVRFHYGDSFGASDYPELPEKEGYYARWDRTQLNDLRFDTTVTAIYTEYTGSLTGDADREDERSVFFVEGNFSEGDTVEVERCDSAATAGGARAEISTLEEDASQTVRDYFADIGEGHMPAKTIDQAVIEHWKLTLPDDGLETHRVRYLPPEGEEHVHIYVRENGQWVRQDAEQTGSYLVFEVSGTEAELAVTSTVQVWWIWVLALGLLGVLLCLLLGLICRARARKKAKKAAQAAEEEARSGAVAAAREAAEAAAARRAEEHEALRAAVAADPAADDNYRQLLERTLSAEERLERQEAELSVLRASLQLSDEEEEEEPPRQTRRRRRWPLVVLAILVLLAAAVTALCLLKPELKNGLETALLFREVTQREELDMTLEGEAQIGGETLPLRAELCRQQTEAGQVTRVSELGVSLYYADGALFLENGAAYQMGTRYPDYSGLIGLVEALCETTQLTAGREGGRKVYTLSASGEDAAALVRLLCPEAAEELEQVDELSVRLYADGRTLESILFTGEAALKGGAALAVDARLALGDKDRPGGHTVPQTVLDAIEAGERRDGTALTEDALRLLSAWGELNGRETLGAEITLAVDCGPLTISDTLDWMRTEVDGGTISRLTKNGQSFYFTEQSVCGPTGNAVTDAEENTARCTTLVDIAYDAFQRGGAACEETENGWRYTLELTEAEMERSALAVAPEAEELKLSYHTGSLEVELSGGQITRLTFRCGGSAKVLLGSISADLEAGVRFKDTVSDSTIPSAVVTALLGL